MLLNSLKKTQLFTLLFLIIAADQLSKIIIRKTLSIYHVIPLFKKYFILTHVENTGAFLSIGNNLPHFMRIILLTVLPSVVLIYGIWILYQKTDLPKHTQTGICLLLGGGIGNMIDRIAFGAVTDFLFMDFVIFRTGVFNVGDMAIMAGLGFLVFDSFRSKKETMPES